MGALLVGLWASGVFVFLAIVPAVGGMGVYAKHSILYCSLIAPCVAGAYASARGRAPVEFWKAVADALFWCGVFAYPGTFFAVVAWDLTTNMFL